jgi:hypothetical protein
MHAHAQESLLQFLTLAIVELHMHDIDQLQLSASISFMRIRSRSGADLTPEFESDLDDDL